MSLGGGGGKRCGHGPLERVLPGFSIPRAFKVGILGEDLSRIGSSAFQVWPVPGSLVSAAGPEALWHHLSGSGAFLGLELNTTEA